MFPSMLRRLSSSRLPARAAVWLILLALVSWSGGCSKYTTSLDGIDFFFRYKVNGALVEYTTLRDVFGVYSYATAGYDILTIAGWDATTSLGLRLSSAQATPGVGTYSIARAVSDSTFSIDIYYQDADSTDYFAEPAVPDDATIVITKVEGVSIEGTFFGVVESAGRPDIMITEGEFRVRREFPIN